MSTTKTKDSVLSDAHHAAIKACLDDIKAIIARDGVNRPALEAVKARLLELTRRTDLFHYDLFPVLDRHANEHSTIYQLAEDADHAFALFAVSERRGNMSPPHDHTTWAVIAGIEGEELNRLYERLDDESVAGKADVREVGQTVIGAGEAVAFLPDDIHSIACVTDTPTLNFHLYGMSIAHLPKRKMFNMRDGTYKVFPANPNIHPA